MATADEVIASVDATLDGWRSAFEAAPTKEDTDGGGPSSPATTTPTNGGSKSPPAWKNPEAYQRRLSTFNADNFNYFAKPLELSPLVCAAFGWENTGKDIIKCCHPKCGATICVLLHPDLNEESHRRLCQKYQGMLASSHTAGCPFRSFARRWSKAMQQCSSKSINCGSDNQSEHPTNENDPEHLIEKVSEGLNDTNPDVYVPPYFLSVSEECLQFEDCSGDGSITKERVEEGALRMRGALQERIGEGTEIDVSVPDAVTNFCQELHPGTDDVDSALHLKDISMKVPYLLCLFGWSMCDESAGEKAAAVVKCNICQAQARVMASQSTDENASRKRRRVENRGDIKLIDSHRVYCPFVSGFSSGDIPGWKVVVSNLLKSSQSEGVVRMKE